MNDGGQPFAIGTVFGMDSTSGVLIGAVLMLVFVLAIVAVSRNEGKAA